VVGIRKAVMNIVSASLLLALSATAAAAVTARVDRPTVDLNESLTLEIVVDDTTDLEPDLTVLETNFYVGQVSKLSNTSIYNGEIRRSLTWTVSLMPKRTGPQEIPPVSVGQQQSNPVAIVVNEPTNAPPGEADVFVTSEIDVEKTYVQAQILYRIRIYRAVATRQPALREPTISGVEALFELAGDERQYEAVLNGRAYNVIERVIAFYPQESGEFNISPARFEARVLRNGRITGRKVFESEAHTIAVLPIPAPPAEFPGAAWLPARDVQLSEEWSRPPESLEAGEPVTRRVQLSALGQIETQLPAMDVPEVDGINVYADKPELSRTLEAGGIRGIREDQYAVIGVAGGKVELPGVEVPWWDIDAGEWKVASLPPRVLTIKGVEPPAPLEPVEAAPVEAEASPDATSDATSEAVIAAVSFWQRATEVLAVAWLLTLAAWWWSSRSAPRKRREPQAPKEPPLHKQQAQALQTARQAAAAGDAASVRAAILEWGRLQWPDNPPLSVGEFANRVEAPLADELRTLSSASYGPRRGGFDSDALANALRSMKIRREHVPAESSELLPPLMPPAA
jgi:hypothetical protein